MTPDEAIALLETYLREACPSYKDGDAQRIVTTLLDAAAEKAVVWQTATIHDAVRMAKGLPPERKR